MKLTNFAHCGLRDLNEIELERVTKAGYPVVWGSKEKHVDFPGELRELLAKYPRVPTMIPALYRYCLLVTAQRKHI